MANRALIAIHIIMTLFTHDNFLKFILQFNKHSKAEYGFTNFRKPETLDT